MIRLRWRQTALLLLQSSRKPDEKAMLQRGIAKWSRIQALAKLQLDEKSVYASWAAVWHEDGALTMPAVVPWC